MTSTSTYPPEASTLIAAIRGIQTKLELKDAVFVRGSSMAASSWYQLVAGSYPWPSTAGAAKTLRGRLDSLNAHALELVRRAEAEAIRERSRKAGNAGFVEFPEFAAVKAAIERCQAKGVSSEERLVVCVAPTRGGKTWMANRLLEEGVATWRVNGTPCWRKSYMAMLRGLAQELRLPDRLRSCAEAEAAVLGKLRDQAGVLLIEEIQLLSRDGQSLIKTVLNETPLSVVLFMTPGFHRLMLRDAGEDLRQLLGRAEATIIAAGVGVEHVKALSDKLGVQWEGDEGPATLARTAQDLGALSGVTRMLRYILRRFPGKPATGAMADAAARAYRRQVPLPLPQ